MGEAHQLVRFFTADELAKNGRLFRAKLRQLREQEQGHKTSAPKPPAPKPPHRKPPPRKRPAAARRRRDFKVFGPEPATNALLTPGDVARLLNVSPKTVSQWATDEGLPSFRTLGGHHRFRWADVQRWLSRDDGAAL
jgi:excisionase family DNA binding protein